MHRVYTYGWKGGPSFGLLVLRLIVGAAFILHGWPKIQNPMAWMGDSVHPILQLASAVAEFGGGIALILGFLTPIVAGALAINMAVALFLVHIPKGHAFVSSGPGGSFELPLVYLGVMVALFFVGPGRFSLDATLWRPRYVVAHEREVAAVPKAA
ncbi:MAG TPA: DoxX family protein [Thermoanaerobaculia bacterium]|nr:DoxX family protein [Thermoanaerobaculia bacterium]